MSTDPVPATAVSKKPRSPAERFLVWGGIVVLLSLVAVQAHARFGYEMTLKKLQAKLAADDDGSFEGAPLYLSDVDEYIVGWPSSKVDKERHWEAVTFSWRGLGKSYTIRMPYDTSEKKPMVLSLETAAPPAEPEIETQVASDEPAEGATPDLASAAPTRSYGPGGQGSGGEGGRRRNIMDSDADGDGKVSRTEAPERLAQAFDRIDANSDGFIDADEAQAARQRRGPRGGDAPDPPTATPAPAAPGEAPADPPADAAAPAQ